MFNAQGSQTNQNVTVGKEKSLLQRPCKEIGSLCPPNSELSEGFQQNIFKGKRSILKARGCSQLLKTSLFSKNFFFVEIFCSYSCPGRSGLDVTVNLQQHKCYFLFCNFLSLYEWKSVTPLKVRTLSIGHISGYMKYYFQKGAGPA